MKDLKTVSLNVATLMIKKDNEQRKDEDKNDRDKKEQDYTDIESYMEWLESNHC